MSAQFHHPNIIHISILGLKFFWPSLKMACPICHCTENEIEVVPSGEFFIVCRTSSGSRIPVRNLYLRKIGHVWRKLRSTAAEITRHLCLSEWNDGPSFGKDTIGMQCLRKEREDMGFRFDFENAFRPRRCQTESYSTYSRKSVALCNIALSSSLYEQGLQFYPIWTYSFLSCFGFGSRFDFVF